MSGDEERVSKRARKNYPGEVSFGALSKEENEHSVAQVSRCTDTGNCTWTEDGTKPQLLSGLGEEGGGGSSLQQMVEEEFGELSFLLGEPQVRTVIIQYSTNGNVCVFSSHPFWTSMDVPAEVTQEEGHTGFLIHLPSAVRALIFVARRIQPFLSLVDREVEFCVLTN